MNQVMTIPPAADETARERVPAHTSAASVAESRQRDARDLRLGRRLFLRALAMHDTVLEEISDVQVARFLRACSLPTLDDAMAAIGRGECLACELVVTLLRAAPVVREG